MSQAELSFPPSEEGPYTERPPRPKDARGRRGRPWIIQRPTPTGAEFVAPGFDTLGAPNWTRNQADMMTWIDQARAESYATAYAEHMPGAYPTQL